MSECQHPKLEKTADKASDGSPIYRCAANCGADLFVVRPMEIEVTRGRKKV
jgi:hypothetical protein